jgi:hypothetical protein
LCSGGRGTQEETDEQTRNAYGDSERNHGNHTGLK